MTACLLLVGLTLAAEAAAPVSLAKRYPAGLFYRVAEHPERRVRHLITPLGGGYYHIQGGRTVAGFMAQSDSNYWPGIRYMDIMLWNPVQEAWVPRVAVAILDISKRQHLEQHRNAERDVPGWGKVRGLRVEVNAELAWRFQFYREGATAVKVLRGPYR
jgi:hypothetical protein